MEAVADGSAGICSHTGGGIHDGGQSHTPARATATNIDNNINWTTSCDYGGEGPTREDEAHLEHFVYLAVKPLPLTAETMAAAASAQFGGMLRNPEVTRPDNIAAERLARHLLAGGGGDRPEEDTGA